MKVGSRAEIHYTGYESDKWREEKNILKTVTYTTDHIYIISLSKWMVLEVTGSQFVRTDSNQFINR